MLYAGWRYAGARGGAALLFAWAVFPYTLYATNQNSNDIVVAALAAIGLATATSPLAREATVSAGFAIKLYPLILAPLWMLYDLSRRRIAPLLKFALGGAVVLLLSFWVLFLGGSLWRTRSCSTRGLSECRAPARARLRATVSFPRSLFYTGLSR